MANKKKSNKESGQDIIVNMGLFWDHEKVCWAQKHGTGCRGLIGVQETAKGNGEIDFWQQQGVYALYHDYHLVYVGQVGLTDKSCLGDRLKRHLSDSLAGRWEKFSWFGFRKVKRNGDLKDLGAMRMTMRNHLADVLEGIVIDIAEPPMNGQKGRFGKRVKRYLQKPKDDVNSQKRIEDDLMTLKKDMKIVLKTGKKNENFCKKFVSKKNVGERMKLYSYIVKHDAGFAPNPFWGYCTLANCKPRIRKAAKAGDWIVGLSPKAQGNKIVYVMQVEEILPFEAYFRDPRFACKKPVYEKGGMVTKRGDNIYEPLANGEFYQHRSGHSNGDKENPNNKKHDLGGKNVLLARNYYYFGVQAIELPSEFSELKVGRAHKCRFSDDLIERFINFISGHPKGLQAHPALWPEGDNSWRLGMV